MAFSVKYIPFLKVNVLHQFFLNNGTDEYLSMTSTEQENRLAQYNVNNFFKIIPTAKTSLTLNGHGLFFKPTGDGFYVWGKVKSDDTDKPFVSPDDDLCLTFLIKYKDLMFLNYTDLKLENSEKLYYFSNRRLSSEPITFPLIKLSGDNVSVDEDFLLSDEGQQDELENLSSFEKLDLFGIVKLFIKGDVSSGNITDVSGDIPESFNSFEILFENRKTHWRYLFDNDQIVASGDDVEVENGDAKTLVTKNEQPLTQHGFVSIELGGVELPNPDAKLIKPNSTNNKIYSEIYM